MIKEENVPNKQLKHARLLKQWTQSQLAEALETDFETVSRWERGITVPSFYFQRKLSDVFGKSAEELGFLADGNNKLPAVALPGVFLAASYADAGHELVTRLNTELQERGIPLTTSRTFRKLDGQQKRKALQEALRAAQVVLLLVSPQARTSRHVQETLQVAKIYKRPVCALWIDGKDWQKCLPQNSDELAGTIDVRGGSDSTRIQAIVAMLEEAGLPSSETSVSLSASSELPEPRNPYKGLRAFRSEDRDDFFGHDQLIDELVAALEGFCCKNAVALVNSALFREQQRSSLHEQSESVQMASFPSRDHLAVRALVLALLAQLSCSGGNDAGARAHSRSYHHLSLSSSTMPQRSKNAVGPI